MLQHVIGVCKVRHMNSPQLAFIGEWSAAKGVCASAQSHLALLHQHLNYDIEHHLTDIHATCSTTHYRAIFIELLPQQHNV